MLLLVALLCFGLQPWRINQQTFGSSHTVYTVAQVQRGLRHHPKVWMGKLLSVRGLVDGCQPGMPCIAIPVGMTGLWLTDPHPSLVTQGIPLIRKPPNLLL